MPTMIGNEEYLTTDEAAEFIGYSRAWFVKTIVPRYHLQPYQKGTKRPILYKRADLVPLIEIRPVAEDGKDGKK